MAIPNLIGSFPLTAAAIDGAITKTMPSAYALGRRSDDAKTFYVNYVGRADTDVGDRLKDWGGSE